MKLTKIGHQIKQRFLLNLPTKTELFTPFVSLIAATLLAAIIWFAGDYLSWSDYAPFAQTEKKIYVILFLFLIWLLKFLMIDLDAHQSSPISDKQLNKKLEELRGRLQGALAFLKKTTITRHNEIINLHDLPWYLLVGPGNAGKTTLLTESDVHFILQKRVNKTDIKPTDHCDWWVTREATIIDVPSKYLSLNNNNKTHEPSHDLWQAFPRLIKKYRGKRGLDGVILTLPLPEIMKSGDSKKYSFLLAQLFSRLQELQSVMTTPLTYYLIITKCDKLPGFSEFFSESTSEEVTQSWGITLHNAKSDDKNIEIIQQQFNALIKKLNQQLLFRLHHERNPMLRPLIKDFPLQIERLKEYVIDFTKKLQGEHLTPALRGIYLTSALQETEAEHAVIEEVNTSQRAVQIFKSPTFSTRPYFIKQLISHGLASEKPVIITKTATPWKQRAAIAASVGVIAGVGLLLGKDFKQGVKQTYHIQNNLSNYRLAIQQISNPNERLIKSLAILNLLHEESVKQSEFKLDINHLLSFYSYKSNQRVSLLYNQALNTLLMPEIKNYLAEFLLIPTNKNADSVYGALKAYLMLGDKNHFQASYILHILKDILPKTLNSAEGEQLMLHMELALNNWQPLPLDNNLIEQTRKYFTAMPDFQLGYIVLKNINGNTSDANINLGMHNTEQVFTSRQLLNQIPTMFTGKSFSPVITDETQLAAQETVVGNWILGDKFRTNKSAELIPALTEQLRTAYVNNYVDVWESLIANIHLAKVTSLLAVDELIINLISNQSPLLQLLQTLHDNTYFEPITTASPKLLNLGSLIDKNKTNETTLYQIFSSLQALHVYLQPIITAQNNNKAAFAAITARAQNKQVNSPDPITQLRLVAERSPEPVKFWLEKIADDTLHYLMLEASRYMDTSWNENVVNFYEHEIANRYPFSSTSNNEVQLDKFVQFFGKPGIVYQFYQTYLQALVDNSTPDWHWKTIDNKKPPFSDETLRQIQFAFRIHQTFFPNGDDKLYVQFGLQPVQFGKEIKQVKLTLDDKQFVDESSSTAPKAAHTISWPSSRLQKVATLQLTTQNEQTVRKHFSGAWGWFKLVNQSFESAVSKKALMMNLSVEQNNAKYLLSTQGQANPFLALNLKHFSLPNKLTDNKA